MRKLAALTGQHPQRLGLRQAELRGPLDQGGDAGLADPSRWLVDDALQAEAVVGVVHQPQIGDGVLDLLALVETGRADQPVGQIAAHEGVFERARLGIGAVEDHAVAGRGQSLHA